MGRGVVTTSVIGAGVVGAGVVGVAGARRSLERRRARGGSASGGPQDPSRWKALTVYLPLEQVGEHPPGPLAELGDGVEVRVRPAPGDKGTEIMARPREGAKAAASVDEVRSALRRSKQLLEVGWVLEGTPDEGRERTPLTALMRGVVQRSGRKGRL